MVSWWFYTGISTNVEKVYLFIYFYCEYLTSAKVEEVNINSKLHVQDINKMCLVSHFEIQNRRTCMKSKQIKHVTLVCSLTLKPTRICWSYSILIFWYIFFQWFFKYVLNNINLLAYRAWKSEFLHDWCCSVFHSIQTFPAYIYPRHLNRYQ